jgi:putative porin
MSISTATFSRVALMCLAMAGAPFASVRAADERQSLEELRNTVINLLQTLVDQGVISREKAAQLVKAAQDKAAADAAALAKSDEGAVRVPYVPQIVKDEISKQVAEAVKPEVVADVIKDAKLEKWGVPGALPDWITRTRLSGMINLREEGVLYPGGNQHNFYLNYYAVNAAGGTSKAGVNEFLQVDGDRFRTRGYARLALETSFTDSITAGMRLSTGNSSDLVSPSQTLDGTAPYQFGIDNLYIRADERTSTRFPWLSVVGGRFNSPWMSPTDLIFHKQLTFNGLAATGRLGVGDGSAEQSHLFLTVAAMPIQEIAFSAKDKWLYGAQLGTNFRIGEAQRLRFALAFYDYQNVEGRENSPNSNLLDYTAPQFLRSGNSLFDIRNDNDPTTNLFALASKFRLVNVAAAYSVPFGQYTFGIGADAVKNLGFNEAEILMRTGQDIAPRVKGYQGDISFGSPTVLSAGAWRTLVGYRYLQRDAVIDAYTDSDFHFGGTNAKGYYFIGDVGLANRVWMRLRYLSSNQIDGPAFAVDTIQIDMNTQF